MEFLGSFWRCHLINEQFASSTLIADFSANAVRRLNLEPGQSMLVQLPAENIMVFAPAGNPS